LTACILSGCEYKPVEDVDYVNAVIIERSTEEPAGGGLRYSLVITGLDDDEDSLTEEGGVPGGRRLICRCLQKL